jgi:hypothetical protein
MGWPISGRGRIGGPRPAGERPLTIVELIRAGTIDADLAALVWLLLEANVPLIAAAGPPLTGKSTLLHALLAFLPSNADVRELAGYFEDFDWMPEAAELGWRSEGPGPGDLIRPRGTAMAGTTTHTKRSGDTVRQRGTTVLLAEELSDHLPVYTWGEQARVAIRAIGRGYGFAATIHAESLEEVFGDLGSWTVGLTQDELSLLGVVLVMRRVSAERRRVVAAHYVRPVLRDAGGHVQRLGPAVLATWDPATDSIEDFSWGITPELADRTGRRPGDFEAERDRRSSYLTGLADARIVDPSAVAAAISGFRAEAR